MKRLIEDLSERIKDINNLRDEVELIFDEIEKDKLSNNIYLKIREIDLTIQNLSNLNIPIPKELIEMKNEYHNEIYLYEKVEMLKREYNLIFSQSRKRKISENQDTNKPKAFNASDTGYANKKLISVTLLGKNYPISKWKDLLRIVLEVMYQLHSDSFNKVFLITGRERPYFSKSSKEMRIACYIDSIDLYYEINISATQSVQLSHAILHSFGYSEKDLEFIFLN